GKDGSRQDLPCFFHLHELYSLSDGCQSAFLNGKLKEEAYVKKPLCFESSEFLDSVCACQLLGGKLVCWSAKKQQLVAMSSDEANINNEARQVFNEIEQRNSLD
nr:hypothetical protein [Tanacetum cinerariifolium]